MSDVCSLPGLSSESKWAEPKDFDPEIESLKEIIRDLSTKMDILMDAVLMSHQLGPDGKCREDCWSCRVRETIRGIQVARKLGAGKP